MSDLFQGPTEPELKERRRHRMRACIKAGTHRDVIVSDTAIGLSYHICFNCESNWGHKPLPPDYNPSHEKTKSI